ncbi:MAG: ABC transporter substrate-binding protein [Deltaproteobacteria bacterium]|nr:ABC transporter substrate-binding protein [Deltaproteobacteria bacterium]
MTMMKRFSIRRGGLCPWAAGLSLWVAAALLLVPGEGGAVCKGEAFQKRPIVVIGEPAVAACLRLKVAPRAWVGRKNLWDDAAHLKAASEFLGCPGRLSGPAGKEVVKRIVELSPERVYLGFSGCLYRPDIEEKKLVKILRGAGLDPVVLDFSKGPAPAVRRLAADFGLEQAGEELIRDYENRLALARQRLAKVPKGLRVAVVSGSFQEGTGKAFIRLEAPQGYSDRFILEPCGAMNVGAELVAAGEKVDKGHVMLRNLDKVMAAHPDLIAATGDALAVSLRLAGKGNGPAPAVFPLPLYADSDPLAYPEALTRWSAALSGIKPAGSGVVSKNR